MQLIAIGLNHTTAPVAIREQVTFSPEHLTHALHEIIERGIASEAAIVSTCNRTELYCHAEPAQVEQIIDWLCQYHNLQADALRKHLYIYADNQQAIHHLLRVACGLDSMVLGEPQILGQLKNAYQTAREAKAIKRLLTKAFEYSFSVAKQVRTDTAIGSSPVSVAFAAVRLAQQIFGELHKSTALLLGAGETIELAARHLSENQLNRMIVANRTVERARTLAKEFAGYAITLEEIPMHLAEADIVIASTASPIPILSKEMVQAAIKIRKHKPIFMVDIAVPRDIAEDVGDLPDVYLYTVDDLNEVIQENLRSRKQAAHQAEEIIETQVSHFMGWLKSLDAVSTIRDLREQTQNTQQALVNKAKRMLDNGKPAPEVIEYIAHTLANKLIHSPCSQLRQASYEGHHEMINMTRQLFQLEEE
ncbi:glutamyl-tRNA reductase [Candidatus Albibeggiatoa sp. nov. BB20]|uniref:glutamyl-tRNA reductase n=1 Tax=Candidatus Albibeggiatoa sp. nov. BB20 TaxID=3162723 RepID=UPI00336565F1